MAESTPERATKTCPFCAEDIRQAAIVCKHCGRDLDTAASISPIVAQPVLAHSSRAFVAVLGLLVIGSLSVTVYKWWMSGELRHAGNLPEVQLSQNDRPIHDFLLNRLNDMLSDPDSARFEGVQLFRTGGIFTLCGRLNAKNSYGGYVGYRRFIVSTFVNPDGSFDKQATSAHIDKGPSRVSLDKTGKGKNWFSDVYASVCKNGPHGSVIGSVEAVRSGTLQEAREDIDLRNFAARLFDSDEALFGGKEVFRDR